MDNETLSIGFLVGIAIGILSVTQLWNRPFNEELCLKIYPNNAKKYNTCINQSIYTNMGKIKQEVTND